MSHVCFFYGTLMSPAVLSRVTTGLKAFPPDHPVTVHSAILKDHKRHGLKSLDYPAVIESKGDQVLGAVAYGITTEELKKLDVFEGDEYERKQLNVIDENSGETVLANVYIWVGSKDILLTEDWNYDNFVQKKMEHWISDEMKQLEEDGRGNRYWDPVQAA